ncbi:MAG TPA: winged helix-turn-helix domain-containing protein [Kribbella sp.]|nr:winged helix-turn-helix domain-containing protein [Kribbella sp.]
MTLLRLSPAALSRCRFAVSPLAETLGSLIALQRSYSEPWLARWHAQHRPAFRVWLQQDEVAAGLMSLVAATKWLPDTVTPPPAGGMNTRIVDELAEVEAHADASVRATVTDAVAASWEPQDTGWLTANGLAGRIATVLEEGWTRFVAPDWPRRRAVLERDIVHRAGVLAAYGWQQAVAGMTRRSVWVGHDAIRFSDQDFPDRLIIDEGLIFVPHTAGGGSWTCERPPRYALVYPARGPAAPSEVAGPDALSTLLGAGRARIVRELATPATSSQLARSLSISLGTVSTHLAVLRESGVVVGARAGRSVIYRLTARGEALATLLDAEPR